jgi:F420-non-reducing hydrogenase iron-sulfur subunit
MDPKRFRVEWISASEGKQYAEIVTEFVSEVKALGPQNTFRIQKDQGE